ncbi:ABC transporter ATP-binding protein [Candidatus Symbiobacter mobilis]|uniref:ABC transporter ATP-binding protein n=1 Tax=Candidatus Symbiobacter mobilis TaxID=1436290 RepID=UPI00059D6E74|nr:ABC transporter ATP-binding protein [Candidatus Symbiobacter mobilis]
MSAVVFDAIIKDYPAARGRKNGDRQGKKSDLRALDGISLHIEEGEFFGLLGPNGAGKTTLISILAGLVRPTQGRVSVLGCDVVLQPEQARRLLGIVPQELVFDPFFRVREALEFQSGYFGMRGNGAWIDELLSSLGLADKADANMRTLSGGMKRRMLAALALVHKPAVIVLDEPTAGVDVELRKTLWQFVASLNSQGHTVLLTTHYLEEAQALCTRIAMLQQGRVVALDTTSALLGSGVGVLRFRVDRALPAAIAATVRVTGEWVEMPVGDARSIEDCLAAVRQAGVTASDVEIRRADLEDVFLEVMHRGARV